MAKTIPDLNAENETNTNLRMLKNALDIIEIICIFWFLLEFIIRFITSPNKLKFIKSPLNLIDLVSSLPYVILFVFARNLSQSHKINLRMLRIFLLFKLTRFSNSVKSLGYTLVKSGKAFFILFIYLSICVLFFSNILYYLEKDVENTHFSSIPATFW